MPAEQLDLELSILFRNFNLFQKNMKGDKSEEQRRADSQLGQYEDNSLKQQQKKAEVKELQKYMKLRNAKKAASEIRTQILAD